jgi:cytochrome P450
MTVTTVPLAPAVPGLPLLGNILDFRRDILAAMRVGWRTRGDLTRHRLGPVTVHGVSSPELAGEVLTNSAVYGKLGADNPLRLVLGTGLLTSSDHESWLRNRRMMQPIYSRTSIADMFAMMVTCTEDMLARLDATHRAGDPLDLHKEMMRVTLDIVSRCMFSTSAAETIDVIGPDAVDIAINYAFQRLQNPLSLPSRWPTPTNRRFQRVMTGLDELMYGLIARRRAGESRGDLLDMLLAARDADTGAGMTDQELRDEIITTFAAGHETTAITLTWTFYLLSQHPQVLRAIQREVDEALAGRLPTLADLRNMPYTLQAFEESMRLYPSAPIVPRLTTRDTVLGGRHIPAGSRILVNLYNIHRHPDHWPDPERFEPARFAPDARKAQQRFAYLPFGAGPHLCIGKHFALMEAHLLLAALVQRYEFRHVPSHPVVNHATITLRPKYGMVMTVHPRKAATR